MTRVAPAWRPVTGFASAWDVERDANAQGDVFRHRQRAYSGQVVGRWRDGPPPAPPSPPGLWARLRPVLGWIVVAYLVAMATAPVSDGVRAAMSLRMCAPGCRF